MPAESKSQQQLFGMVHAYQKGMLKNPSPKIKEVAEHISKKDAKDFAATKTKHLPVHVKKGFVTRAMEIGYTEGQAVDMFNKIANDVLMDVNQHTAIPLMTASGIASGIGHGLPLGAILGAIHGSEKDEKGETHRLRDALLGAGMGATGLGIGEGALGAVGGLALKQNIQHEIQDNQRLAGTILPR